MRRYCSLGIMLVTLLMGCASTKDSSKLDDESLGQLYSDMGLAYLRRGEYDLARERLDKALKLNPRSADTQHYLGELLSRTGEAEKAEEHYLKAIELRPNDPNIQNNFGVYLCSRQRMAEAEPFFLAAIANPTYQTRHLAYENLGRCAISASEKRKAEGYFREALKLQPKLPISLLNMARLVYDKGEYLKARAYFERYQELGRFTPKVLWLGMLIESKLKDEKMVAQYADILKLNFPSSPEAEKLLTLEKEGKLSKFGELETPLEMEMTNGDVSGITKK